MLPILGFFLTVTSSPNPKLDFSTPRFLSWTFWQSHLQTICPVCLSGNGMLNMPWDCWYSTCEWIKSNASDAWSSFVFFCPPFSSYSKVLLSLLEPSCLTVPALLHERTYCVLCVFLILCCSYNSCVFSFSLRLFFLSAAVISIVLAQSCKPMISSYYFCCNNQFLDR